MVVEKGHRYQKTQIKLDLIAKFIADYLKGHNNNPSYSDIAAFLNKETRQMHYNSDIRYFVKLLCADGILIRRPDRRPPYKLNTSL